jgi:Domain of unknown function (DUF4760)
MIETFIVRTLYVGVSMIGRSERTWLYASVFFLLLVLLVFPLIDILVLKWIKPEEWTAIGTLILALVTSSLFLVGYWEIMENRSESKISRTLDICNRYDNDVIFDQCLREIAAAKLSSNFSTDDDVVRKLRTQIITILNYLDSVAIGIEQGSYVETLAKDHLHPILRQHTEEFLDGPIARKIGIDRRNYDRLLKLATKWNEPVTGFKSN